MKQEPKKGAYIKGDQMMLKVNEERVSMNIYDFQPTSSTYFHNHAADVDAAEKELGTPLPTGYREFISRFGEGLLAGYVRVYPPHQILEGDNSVTQWRKRIGEYWFWDEGRDVLTKEKALECVIIADTLDGDELAAHPSEPDRLYVFPRNEEKIYVAGDGFLAALEWLLASGTITEPIEDRTFEPFNSRAMST